MAVIKKENCKSCGYCIRACKQGALSVSSEINGKGYAVVEVDQDKCIGCGICYTVCPDYVITIKNEEVQPA